MSESLPPPLDADFVATLHRIAQIAANPEPAQLARKLATQLDQILERHADAATAALGTADLAQAETQDLRDDMRRMAEYVSEMAKELDIVAARGDMTLKLLLELERRYFPQLLPQLEPLQLETRQEEAPS